MDTVNGEKLVCNVLRKYIHNPDCYSFRHWQSLVKCQQIFMKKTRNGVYKNAQYQSTQRALLPIKPKWLEAELWRLSKQRDK